jgi:sugar phosphate permease
MLAAVVTALVLPRYGWRVLFLTGLAPALLALAIRRGVAEPELWQSKQESGSIAQIFRAPLLGRTIAATALATSVLFAYWGLFTWIPGFLSASPAQGGAGLNIVGTSAWIFPMQAGAFLGYVTFGVIADRAGRRPAFLLYVLGAAALVPIYGLAPRLAGAGSERLLLLLGPLVGFFGTGYFALFGVTLAEIYPTAVRGAGQGFTYNFGRALSALAPYSIGAVADRSGLGTALACNSGFFLIAAVLVFALPETKRAELAP